MNQANVRDIVYLSGLQCPCKIGVYEWERHVNQTLLLDIELETNTQKAAENDELNDALDYQAVAERVQAYAKANTYKLIETLIERIAELILAEFKTPWVRIKLDKGNAVKGVKNVGLIIERHA